MIKGGQFLLTPVDSEPIFTPEDLSSEQKALGETAQDFIEKEVLTVNDKIESKEKDLIQTLLKKAGGIGLLMAEIPENHGGLGLGKIAATILSENSSAQGSFQVSMMCHTGIGTLPIIYWGTEDQKNRYLPKLATGEMLAAYALTEANAGSDALAGRTTAVLSKDGSYYLLNGEKVFITNGGFADLFTIFAKVDGKTTAFLVERGFQGVSIGPEEKKMGIHGSSTVPVNLADVKVPKENVLGEVGKGHKIAFNTLNVGRWKLGAACVGACKYLLKVSAKYVGERVQFNQPIAKFEVIRHKIADCVIKTHLLETIIYRYAGLLDEAHAKAKDNAEKLAQLEEYAIEASIAKVFGSEVLQFVADESVQMHGGYGFCDDYQVERFYRDCRVNRIFEGTNEINRFVIVQTLLKRAMAGTLDMMTELGNILQKLKTGFEKRDPATGISKWLDATDMLKKLVIYIAGVAVQKYADKLQQHQALISGIADMVIDTYVIDSGFGRAIKTKNNLDEECAKVYLAERLPHIKANARQLLINIAEGDEKEFGKYERALDRVVPSIVYDTGKGKEIVAAKILS